MKTKFFILAALSFSMIGFAQKNELKAAEKAFKGGDAMAAKSTLEAAAGLIDGAEAKYQAQYHQIRGMVYAQLAKDGDDNAYKEAVTSMKKVIEIEDKAGKAKYSSDMKQKLAGITAELVNSAVADNGKKNYKQAAEKLYMSYQLSPADTLYLYYAASSAVNGAHYEQALGYYNELQKIGYNGSTEVFKATNNETGEVETLDKVTRDLYIKAGTHKDPVDEKTEPKTAEIVKNTALIYGQLGQDDKALEAYAVARADNPDDVNLILQEANLHYKQGNKEKFKTLMAQASEMEPNNPDLLYNIGVINMEQGNISEARDAYRKALVADPSYTNAQLNLSTTYVNEGNGLIDEMNALGNSRSDAAKYDSLKQKKDDLFKEGAKILEDALTASPGNQSILNQLKNIYGAMGDNDNFMRIKKLLAE